MSARSFKVQLSAAGQVGVSKLSGPAQASLGRWLANAVREPNRVAEGAGPNCLRLPGLWAIYEVDEVERLIAVWDVGPGSPAAGLAA